ncbi:MAG: flagellar basal body L-ring protein FlgH [Thermodesulfobacteriota bacterium]|nr:flagellar basal body L-ring protein FlgH [Thermodesulfobacteriota bacterium]
MRPQDISQNNIVYSSSIADAKIAYTGQGVIAEKQMVGWGTRIVDYLWPF